MTQCVERWQLSEKLHLVLRDNGRNFVAGLRHANIPNVGCLTHTLQLVVNEGVMAQRQVQDVLGCCRRIVGHFKHSNISWHALLFRSLVCPCTDQYRMSRLSGILPCYMLSWISEQNQALLAVSTDVSLPCELTTCQWQVIEKVLHVLQPFEEATKEAEYLTASISIVIPIVNALIRQLEKECEDEGIKAMKRRLLASLLTWYQDMEENKFFAVATTLDPRYKL